MTTTRLRAGLLLLAWLVYAGPHFAFHLVSGHAFSLADNVANMVLLAVAVLLPLVLLAGSRGGEHTPRTKDS
jgi:hypothetical protein